MRIMMVVADFRDSTFAGRAFGAQHDAVGVAARGHEVVVVTNTGHSTLRAGEVRRGAFRGVPVMYVRTADDLRVSGVDGEAWEGRIGAVAERAAGEAAVSDAFRRLLTAVRPDVVWCETGSDFGVALAEVALAAPDRPPLVLAMPDARWCCERGSMVRGNGRRCGQIAIDPAVCGTCVVSSSATAQWERRRQLVLDAQALVVVPSAELHGILLASGIAAERVVQVHPVRAEPWGEVVRTEWPGPLRLGFIDGLNDGVGFEQMIRTFQRITRSDYEFTVANGTTVFGVREFNVGDWGIPGYVHITDPLTADTAASFFDSIDVLVMPSRWQSHFGLTVQAAIAHGVWPVVADGVGAGECLRDGVDGTLVPPDADPATMAEVLTAVIARRSAAAVAEFRTLTGVPDAPTRPLSPAPAAGGAATLVIDRDGRRVAEVERCLQRAVAADS